MKVLTKAFLLFKILDLAKASLNVSNGGTDKESTISSPGLVLPEEEPGWRSKNFAYEDKISYLIKLLKTPDEKFFMMRRPECGHENSVFLGMMEDYFRGRANRFKGLEIEQEGNVKYMLDDEISRRMVNKSRWVEFPVIHLNFSNNLDFTSIEEFKENYFGMLSVITEEYNITRDKVESQQLVYLITKLYEKFNLPVIVLIDEGDAPYHYAASKLRDFMLKDSVLHYLEIIFDHIKTCRGKIGFNFVMGHALTVLKCMTFDLRNVFRDLTRNHEMLTAVYGFTEDKLDT